jgi:N-acyl-D-aspartate/D-glutamate deacylase
LRGRLYATHTRNAPEASEAIAEPIRASVASGVSLQISHIAIVARLAKDGGAAVEQAIEQVEAAGRSGLDVAFDMHTRHFGTTHLSAALPAWALEGGKLETERRLRGWGARAEMKKYSSLITSLARGDWSRIVVFDSKVQPEIARRSIAELSAERGTDPFDTIYDILLAEIDDLHGLLIIAFAYREEDLRAPFSHPLCMPGSDATTLAPDGPLAGKTFHGAYTWAAWFYRHFVLERRMLTTEEAIRRMTSLPAQRLRIVDRGVIRPGAFADLAIFDPATLQERGDTFEPNRTATGMVHVFVNGKQAMDAGRIGGERSGKVLRA